ncbi:PD-(D/E)XK nuclease family protein [Candidatus Pacearchaeota archaeon]|nr:PD-(D/E)XK nuclease family protein [Candidatus Pacearchaeota archaeon]
MNRTECQKPTLEFHSTWNIDDGSKLTEFMTCPRSYFYQYICGWRPETPSNHLVFGTAWHEALEHLMLHGYEPEFIDEAYEKFLKKYRETFGPETDSLYEPKTPANAQLVLYAYAAKWGASDKHSFETLHTEIGGSVSISEDRKLYFRMDSICRDLETQKIFSLEHKTGSKTWNWELQWPLSMQIGCYTHVLYCLFDSDEVLGIRLNGTFFTKAVRAWESWQTGNTTKYKPPFDFLRLPFYRTPPQMQQWLWTALFWMDQLQWNYELLADCTESDQIMTCFPCNATACSKYFGCDYRDFCSAWRNPLQRTAEPPLGFIIDRWDPTAEPTKVNFNLDRDGIVEGD